MPVPSRWHPGEIAAQQARGYEDAAWGAYEAYEEGAPSFMASFLCSLPFLSITTLDQHGLPWTSLICNDGETGFLELVRSEATSRFKCTIKAQEGVPVRECLLRLRDELQHGTEPYDDNGDARPQFQVAGVGVMLHNRRRNKMQGVIVSIDEIPTSKTDDRFVFRLDVSNTFGNCPKYINTRQLIPVKSDHQTQSFSHGDGPKLPPQILSIISSADMLFLATKHSGSFDAYPADPPHLGNNIRGGQSGFLRTFFDKEAQRHVIVLPDWSGNRFLQSFGNMTDDPVAGITIPIWSSRTSTDVLHLTCDALVLSGEDASQLLRGVQGAVKLWPKSWSLVRGCLPLKEANDSIGWSPYNPPVRLLNSEKPSLAPKGMSRPLASLLNVHFWSPQIATFTFKVDVPLSSLPGQHIVLDCFSLLDTRVQMYAHMAQYRGGEKDLNDDGTRSWTISYANSKSRQFEVTLRRKGRGGVTPGLFQRGHRFLEDGREASELALDVLGVDGSCLLPLKEHPLDQDLYLAYIVSGIGLTPLLPHLSQVNQSNIKRAKVLVIAAVRWDEVDVTKQLIHRALNREHGGTTDLRVTVFILAGAVPDQQGRSGDTISDADQGTEAALPSHVTLEFIVSHGQRLQSRSLSIPQDISSAPASDRDFILPREACANLKRAKQVVICGGNVFSRIAVDALQQAGVLEDIVKKESFSF